MRWARHGRQEGTYGVLVGRPEGKRPLGRPTHRLGNIIKMDLYEAVQGGMDLTDLAQDRDRW